MPRRSTRKSSAVSSSSPDETPPTALGPSLAPAPASSLRSSNYTGASVSSDVASDTTPWSFVVAGAPHSRRDTTRSTTRLTASNDSGPSPITTDPSSSLPGLPAPTEPSTVDDDINNILDSGSATSADRSPPLNDSVSRNAVGEAQSIASIFAELDLLRTQASGIQDQLDRHRTVLTRSLTTLNTDLQTLLTASSSNSDMSKRAMHLAQESYDKVLECNTRVDQFFDTYQAPASFPTMTMGGTSSSPPPDDSSVEAAFQATEAALSDGLAQMEHELGSHLDRNINARDSSEPSAARFTNVTYTPRSTSAYSSNAAYAAAHPDSHTNPASASPGISTTTLRNERGGDGVHNSAPNAFGDGLSPRYNGPNSPRHRNALMRGCTPDILLWHAGGSLGDPVCGCAFMEAEDVEQLDISSHLAVGIAEDHFGIIESWDNPRWSQKDMRDFNGSVDGYRAPSTGGPHTADILKQIASWEKVSDFSPTGWQAFYNRLRRFSFKWNIALMPFKAINLKYECRGHALCTCGLGLARWKRMGDALFLVLEYLLPETNSIISTNLSALANGPSAANGYELLWILLKEFIPMFDRSRPAAFPTWSESMDIFQFARMLLMYCTLSHHRGPPYSEAMKSRMFLSNVRGRYSALATQYSAMVGTYCPGRDGVIRCNDPLPHHLTVMELARTFYDELHASTPTPSVTLPSIQAFHTTSSTSTPGLLPTTPVSSITDEHHSNRLPTTATRPTHLQGFSVHAVTRSQRGQRPRSAPNPTSRDARSSAFPCHEAPCEACGKYGHPASRCDMLGMAIWLLRYFKDKSNTDTMAAVEARWVERNKKFLPRDDRTPRTILANYCTEMEFTEEQVDDELDWDYLSAPADAATTDE